MVPARIEPAQQNLKSNLNLVRIKNRTYKNFEKYLSLHKGASVVEMDTVYNDTINCPIIQTFQIVDLNLQISLYQKKKTADAMVSGLEK